MTSEENIKLIDAVIQEKLQLYLGSLKEEILAAVNKDMTAFLREVIKPAVQETASFDKNQLGLLVDAQVKTKINIENIVRELRSKLSIDVYLVDGIFNPFA